MKRHHEDPDDHLKTADLGMREGKGWKNLTSKDVMVCLRALFLSRTVFRICKGCNKCFESMGGSVGDQMSPVGSKSCSMWDVVLVSLPGYHEYHHCRHHHCCH